MNRKEITQLIHLMSDEQRALKRDIISNERQMTKLQGSTNWYRWWMDASAEDRKVYQKLAFDQRQWRHASITLTRDLRAAHRALHLVCGRNPTNGEVRYDKEPPKVRFYHEHQALNYVLAVGADEGKVNTYIKLYKEKADVRRSKGCDGNDESVREGVGCPTCDADGNQPSAEGTKRLSGIQRLRNLLQMRKDRKALK